MSTQPKFAIDETFTRPKFTIDEARLAPFKLASGGAREASTKAYEKQQEAAEALSRARIALANFPNLPVFARSDDERQRLAAKVEAADKVLRKAIAEYREACEVHQHAMRLENAVEEHAKSPEQRRAEAISGFFTRETR